MIWRRRTARPTPVRTEEPSPQALLDAADRAREAEDWPAAAAAFGTILERQPDSAEIRVQYGHALKEGGDLSGAAEAYRRALASAPGLHETRLHLAHCLKNAGRLAEATVEFRALGGLGLFSDDVHAHLSAVLPDLFQAAADRHRDEGRWPEAEVAYAATLDLAPDRPHAWIQLAHARKEQGRLEAAVTAYEEAASRAPSDPEPWLHLGHLFRRTGPRDRSVQAFARACALGRRDADVVEALRNAAGYSTVEIGRAIAAELRALGRDETDLPAFARVAAQTATGNAEIAAAPGRAARPFDVVYLSGIDWGYRRQRPQHMAAALAAAGHRVFYVSTVFDCGAPFPGHAIVGHPTTGVVEIRLRTPATGAGSLHFGLTDAMGTAVGEALAAACRDLCASPPVIVVDHPAWYPACRDVPRGVLVYDCIDNVGAFPDASPALAAAEAGLIERADLVVTTSPILAAGPAKGRPVAIVPNGCESARFSTVAEELPSGGQVRIVYYGAIAAWFDWEWIDTAARRHPEWKFQLIGEVGTDAVEPLRRLDNVEFVGEVGYSELPDYLRGANAAIVPFRLNDLTTAVNPVKVYEYLAAGRPVVASAMPELEAIPWVRIAADAEDFARALADEIGHDDAAAHRARSDWAAAHDWIRRAADFAEAISARLSSPGAGSESDVAETGRRAPENGFPFADFILFVAPFPKAGIVVEGWMGRIRAVDEIFEDVPRIYLHFTPEAKASEEPRWVRHSAKAYEIFVAPGASAHHELVERAIRACRFCYVQTVHLAKYVIGFYPTGKLITDFHGIVPEEEVMLGNPEAAIFYEAIESTILQCSQYIVVVTEAMARHLREKYPFAHFEVVVLPIIVDYEPINRVDAETATKEVTALYAGGSQVWQNIDLMLETISTARAPARYVIASHDHVGIAAKARGYGIADRMSFGVYGRDDLPKLYASADFGFVLRDDTAVNRVACPTKLTEYLEFGIIPIVKLVEIGDFASLGYEYVTGEEYAAGIIPGREQRQRMIEKNRAVLRRLRERFRSSSQRLRSLAPTGRIPCGDPIGLPSFNPIGSMPWKREVYVFGEKMTYVSAWFLRPYGDAEFILPPGTRGDLIRVVPMLGDFIGRIDRLTLVVDEPVRPVVVQSRAQPLPSGDCFGSEAPFFEIRLSVPTEIRCVRLAIRFVETGPGVWKSAWTARNDDRRPSHLTIEVEAGGETQEHDLVVKHV